RTEHLTQTHQGAFVAVRADVGGHEVLAVSLYGILEGPLLDNIIYSVTSVHRSLSDLTPLLGRSRAQGVVLGGDLNVTTQLANPDRDAHRAVFARIDAFGLANCTSLRAPSRGALPGCPCDEPEG